MAITPLHKIVVKREKIQHYPKKHWIWKWFKGGEKEVVLPARGDFITQLFCRVDNKLTTLERNHKQMQAKLYPSKMVILRTGLLRKPRGRVYFVNHEDGFTS